MPERFHVVASPGSVDGWASRRLPFEPTGAMADYRAALRSAVGRLEPADGEIYGAYSSSDPSPCDVENVLLYNVGLSAFDRSTSRLVVERFFELSSHAPAEAVGLRHHHHYSCDAQPATVDWATVASWPATRVTTPLKVEQVWAALRSSVLVSGIGDHRSDRLSIELTVDRPPAASGPTLLAMVKVLIDGAVSTLHAHDGTDLHDVADRLASRLGTSEDVITGDLLDGSAAVLGTRRLVWPYRNFVQWNPADDQLVRASVDSQQADAWRVGGRLRACQPYEDHRCFRLPAP